MFKSKVALADNYCEPSGMDYINSMFKAKIVLSDNYCEPVRRAYTATVDYTTTTPNCAPNYIRTCVPYCDETVYVRGSEGLSAYQIAVKNGFIGTEAQWLVSIGGAIHPEIITFTGATGAVIVDYGINSRRTLYSNPTYQVYIVDGNTDTSIGGYGVIINRVAGVIDNITFDGLFGTGYILLISGGQVSYTPPTTTSNYVNTGYVNTGYVN